MVLIRPQGISLSQGLTVADQKGPEATKARAPWASPGWTGP